MFAKQYYRKKDVKLLVKELAEFRDKYDLNFLMFVDDIFPLHEVELMEEFCSLYKEHVGLPFSVNLQPRIVKEEGFKLAVEAGMRNICCGVESGSKKIRRNVLKRNYDDEHVVKVMNLAHKYNIRCSSFNILIEGLLLENCVWREVLLMLIKASMRMYIGRTLN